MGNYYWSRSSCGGKDHLSSQVGKRYIKQECTSLIKKGILEICQSPLGPIISCLWNSKASSEGMGRFQYGRDKQIQTENDAFLDSRLSKHLKNWDCIVKSSGFPGGSAVKNLLADAGGAGDEDSIPGLEDSLEDEMATYSSVLPGKSCGLRSLAGYSPWDHKDLMTKQQQSEVVWAERRVSQEGALQREGTGALLPQSQSWGCRWRKLLPHLTQQRWTRGSARSAPLCVAQQLRTEAPAGLGLKQSFWRTVAYLGRAHMREERRVFLQWGNKCYSQFQLEKQE